MHSKQQLGFSLIGVLISGIIVAVIAVGLTQTIVRNQQATNRATNRFIAANIAQAGLEHVRANRDNQWLKDPELAGINEDLCNNIPESKNQNFSLAISCKSDSDTKLLVEARVSWQIKESNQQEVIIKEELYDWLPRN